MCHYRTGALLQANLNKNREAHLFDSCVVAVNLVCIYLHRPLFIVSHYIALLVAGRHSVFPLQ